MHFVDIVAVGEDCHDTLNRLMAAVHGFNAPREAQDRVAVAFPAMVDAIVNEQGKLLQAQRSGAQLRCFGRQDSLQAFLASATPARVVKLGMAAASAINEAPTTSKGVRFTRYRRFERGHKNGAYARRQAARAQAAGRELNLRTTSERCESFSFSLRSKRTGQEFKLDVHREWIDGAPALGAISAYGLAGEGSILPVF